MRPLGADAPRGIGPYRTVAELGRGGMGRVLLATSPDGRLVAVKQVHARLAADGGFRERFRREVAASRRVSGAFTAAVVDADTEAPTPWLASEFVPGPSLGAAVAAAGPLPEEPVRRLAAGLATALAEVHRAGLVHRDLKPANVLLAGDGPRVIDFGIARAAEGADGTELTRTGLVVGSPPFMSPEQADGREVTAASDVFSLGTVLVAALTGASPFAGTAIPQTLFNVVHTEPDLGAVPPGLRPVVAACLAKDPGARPSPGRLLELVGEVAPASRPWPPAVHAVAAGQRAEIDRLLADLDRTVVQVPGAAFPGRPGAAAAAPAQAEPLRDERTRAWPTLMGLTRAWPTLVARSPARRRRVLAAAAAAAVLAAVAIGGGSYATWPEDEPSGTAGSSAGGPSAGAAANGGTSDPGGAGGSSGGGAAAGPATARTPGAAGASGGYLEMPVCSEAAPELPLSSRNPKQDQYTDLTYQAWTSCVWDSPSAWVRWDLKRSVDGRDGPADQKAQFAERAADGGTPADGLGFGDSAFWSALEPADGWVCALVVLKDNLVVDVRLGGNQGWSECRAKAPEIARAAIAAMPSR
ncbi:serine/threonine-protein kinase [Spirillospora sp. NPDC052242]